MSRTRMSYAECGTQSDGDELEDDHDLFRAIQVSASEQSFLYLTNESIAWRQYRRPYLCTIWWLADICKDCLPSRRSGARKR
jgi:hypothetical protein